MKIDSLQTAEGYTAKTELRTCWTLDTDVGPGCDAERWMLFFYNQALKSWLCKRLLINITELAVMQFAPVAFDVLFDCRTTSQSITDMQLCLIVV